MYPVNERPTSPSQSPTDSKFNSAWVQAAHDPGISVESPFTLRAAEGEFTFLAHIPDFGSPLGTLAVRGHLGLAFAAAQAAGYFVSILGDGYVSYDRQLFIDTLNDWQYFGPHQPLDQAETEDLHRRSEQHRTPGLFGAVAHYFWLRREVSALSLNIRHWQTRPDVRRYIWLGLGFLAVAFIAGQFASFPRQ